MICSICGEDKELNFEGICNDCAASILLNKDIPPNAEDFF